jgi:hypothetical protein
MNSVSSVMPKSAGRLCGNIRRLLKIVLPAMCLTAAIMESFCLRSRHCCVRVATTPPGIPEQFTPGLKHFPALPHPGKTESLPAAA